MFCSFLKAELQTTEPNMFDPFTICSCTFSIINSTIDMKKKPVEGIFEVFFKFSIVRNKCAGQ